MPNVQSSSLVTSLTSPPDVTQTYFDTLLLDRAEYYLFHEKWATKKSIRERQGKAIILRRYAHVAAAISPLVEGVPPTGKIPTLTDFTATLNQFGDFVPMTDYVRFTQKDPILNEFTELMGEQAGYTVDSVSRDVAIAGTGVIFSNGTVRTALNTIIDGNDLDRAIRVLRANGARMMVEGDTGSTTEGTFPVMPAYPAVTRAEVFFDLQNLTGYRTPEQYKGGMSMMEGEVGRYKNLVFFQADDPSSVSAGAKKFAAGGATSSLVTNTGGTADVFTILIFGRGGFTTVPTDGDSTGTFMKELGSAGTGDPINQVSTVGWKNTSARLITNQNWLERIECAASL